MITQEEIAARLRTLLDAVTGRPHYPAEAVRSELAGILKDAGWLEPSAEMPISMAEICTALCALSKAANTVHTGAAIIQPYLSVYRKHGGTIAAVLKHCGLTDDVPAILPPGVITYDTAQRLRKLHASLEESGTSTERAIGRDLETILRDGDLLIERIITPAMIRALRDRVGGSLHDLRYALTLCCGNADAAALLLSRMHRSGKAVLRDGEQVPAGMTESEIVRVPAETPDYRPALTPLTPAQFLREYAGRSGAQIALTLIVQAVPKNGNPRTGTAHISAGGGKSTVHVIFAQNITVYFPGDAQGHPSRAEEFDLATGQRYVWGQGDSYITDDWTLRAEDCAAVRQAGGG